MQPHFSAAAFEPDLLAAVGPVYEHIHAFGNDAHALPACLRWLEDKHLTAPQSAYWPTLDERGLDFDLVVGLPMERKSRADLDAIKKQFHQANQSRIADWENSAREAIWNERKKLVLPPLFDRNKMPADAMAFYRPFHLTPSSEWGIYLYADRLLRYASLLDRAFAPRLRAFRFDTLLTCVLFEVFHHEFFHHIVECAATTAEVLFASTGKCRPLYLDYLRHSYEHKERVGPHPHKPLEEALANAYAYNSFSFISRVKVGYKNILVKNYQKVLRGYWPHEPPGYHHAENYIQSAYVSGAAQLLTMIVASADLDPGAALLISRHVLLNGNSAFLPKPDIPTYLVGSPEALETFHDIIPAPNETYTSLFWPADTTALDKYLLDRAKVEQNAKKSPVANTRRAQSSET